MSVMSEKALELMENESFKKDDNYQILQQYAAMNDKGNDEEKCYLLGHKDGKYFLTYVDNGPNLIGAIVFSFETAKKLMKDLNNDVFDLNR